MQIQTLVFYFCRALRLDKDSLKYIVLAFVIACTLGCTETAEDIDKNTDRYIKQANSYLQLGQYRAAIIEARNAIQKKPSGFQGHVVLANIFNELGQFKQSAIQLEALPEQAFDNSAYTQALITAYLGRGKFKSSMTLLEKHGSTLDKNSNEYKLLLAQTYLGLKKIEQAKIIYQDILTNDPENIDALLFLARVNAEQSNHSTVNALLDRADISSPGNPNIELFKAQLNLTVNEYESAEKHLTEALSNLPNTDMMTPQKTVLLSLLAQTLAHLGRSAEALVYTQIIADAFPGVEVAEGDFQEAAAHFESGDFKAAEKILTRLVDSYPNYDDASIMLGVIKYRAGEAGAAAKYFGDLVDPEIATANLTKMAAIANLQSNHPEKVVALLEGYLNISNDAQLLVLYGHAALQSKQYGKAEKAFQAAIRQDPSLKPAYLAIAHYYNTKEPPEPLKALDQLKIGYDKDTLDASITKAYVQQLIATEEIERARELIKNQLQLRSRDTHSLQLAGDFYFSQQQFELAKEHYRKALDGDPKNYLSTFKLAVTIQKTETFDKALSAFSDVVIKKSDIVQPYQYIILAANTAEELTRSEDTIVKLAEKTHSVTGYAVLARYFSEQENIKKARKYSELLSQQAPESKLIQPTKLAILYSEAQMNIAAQNMSAVRENALAGLKISPQSPKFLILLTEVEIETQNYAEAQKIITRISSINKNLSDQLQGDWYQAQSNYVAASISYQAAWQNSPNELLAGKLYAALKGANQGDDIAFLAQWLEKIPNSIQASTIEATHLLVSQQFIQAISLLERIQALDPQFAENLNNLAWAYQQTANPKALGTAKEAYRLKPTQASIADTYGWILFEQDFISEAQRVLTAASELDPNNAEIKIHLEAAMNARNKGT